MDEGYISDEEYEVYFPMLNNVRKKIVEALPLRSSMTVLDLTTGYSYFAIEAARAYPIEIVGIDIAEDDVSTAERNIAEENLEDCISIRKMDATAMEFSEMSFDAVINFLGLEDIHMTRGREGVFTTFSKVHRVLKPDGYFCFVVMPPEEMETDAQRIEVEIFSYICNATWLKEEEYTQILEDTGFELIKKRSFRTGKKLTPTRAKEEIAFACDNVPKIYGFTTPSFDDVWRRFGERIEKNGMGHYSKIVLMIAKRL